MICVRCATVVHEFAQPANNNFAALCIADEVSNEPWNLWQQRDSVWNWRRANRVVRGKLSVSAPPHPFQTYGPLPQKRMTTCITRERDHAEFNSNQNTYNRECVDIISAPLGCQKCVKCDSARRTLNWCSAGVLGDAAGLRPSWVDFDLSVRQVV